MKRFYLGCAVGFLSGLIVAHFLPKTEKYTQGQRNSSVRKFSKSVDEPKVVVEKPIKIELPVKHKLSPEQIYKADANKILNDAITTSDPSRAYELYQDAYAKSPTREVLELYSNFLVNYQLWDEAFLLLNKCVDRFPDSDLCQGNLVNYSFNEKDLNKRKNAIDTCLAANSRNLICLNALGVYSLTIRQFENALSAFRKMASINHSSDQSFDDWLIDWGIGLSFNGLGDKQQAEEYFEKACSKRYEPACVELDKLRQAT